MREIEVENKFAPGLSPPPSPYEQVIFWRHQRDIALWLIAEKDYLLSLERRLHQDQMRQHRRYKNQLNYTLKWLLAEARHVAEQSEIDRLRYFHPQATVTVYFPWGAREDTP